MEGLPMVSYSTGTINSLLDKLTKMKNHSNATKEFSELTQEFKMAVLSLKEVIFDKHAVPKVCMKQVRELVLQIEDWIDQKPEANMLDPSDIEEIGNFMTEIKEARERFTWYYDLLKVVPTEPAVARVATSNININPRLLVEEKPCHGLLDGPRDELIKHLSDDKDEMRKVVSIVGMEGLGKTTLAKEIYSELQLRQLFNCQAFVSVGRRRPMRETLDDILCQVKPWSIKLPIGWSRRDVHKVITELRDHLGTKRYFIVVDGIWSTWEWKVINCALPNNRGSRVLTTSCIIDVGISCSSYPNDLVYQMEELNSENSRILFLSKTVTLQEEEKWDGFEEDCCYMLKMCGGMPLAIIVAASLLLTRKSEAVGESKMIGKSIHSSLDQYSTSECMTTILQMSYADLSIPLRSCFLYLSIFPENYTIRKDRLMQLWVAEGFILRIVEECLWVTGERYFNELISRRLIQPVFDCDDDQALGCTVHAVILHFIRSLSIEENFATREAELNSGSFPCDTIRRLSLDCRNEDESVPLYTSIVHLSSMRSLTVFGDISPSVFEAGEEMLVAPAMRVPKNILSAFKLMRVLDLEDTIFFKNHHLEGIGQLVLLRYLGLAGTDVYRLPEEIGELEQLETLDWSRSAVRYLPRSVFKLQKLTHLLLRVDGTAIWEMPELEVASDIRVQSSSSICKVVELMRSSERLRMLGITLTTPTVSSETDLVSFLEEVVKSKLQFLCLRHYHNSEKDIPMLLDLWERVTAPLGKQFEPQRFELKILGFNDLLKRVPPNMDSLGSLTHLHINLAEAKEEDFLLLGGLTNLVLLNLCTSSHSVSGRYIIEKGIFPCLKVFSCKTQYSWRGLEFKEGAMLQLQKLGRGFRLGTRGNQDYLDIGIEHLPCLTQVHATIDCRQATISRVEAAEAAIRGQVSVIATRPTLKFSREHAKLLMESEQMHVHQGTSILQFSSDIDDLIPEDEGEHFVPSKRQVSENLQKSKLHRSISFMFENMKDLGRKLIGRPKLPDIRMKYEFESELRIEDEDDEMWRGEGKQSSKKTSIRKRPETQVTEERII